MNRFRLFPHAVWVPLRLQEVFDLQLDIHWKWEGLLFEWFWFRMLVVCRPTTQRYA